MNVFLKISLVLLGLAFGVILWQGGHATRITYLGVAPFVLWVVFLVVCGLVGYFRHKRSNNVNSFALLALFSDAVLSEKASVLVFVALVFIWMIGRTIATAPRVAYGDTHYPHPPKWYRNPKFSLLPILTIKPANEHNTAEFSFDWLFLRLWTLDAFGFELAIVADSHWGIGVNGILPYVRWVCCIPCPERLGMWLQTTLWRRPKPQEPKPWFMKKVAC
jgi:hypothetical protein